MNAHAMPGKNRHPVDELADVRAEIKRLSERETELKTTIGTMMADRDSLGGDDFIAFQKLSSRKGGIDEKAVAKALGVDDLTAYRKPAATYITLTVEPRVAEVA